MELASRYKIKQILRIDNVGSQYAKYTVEDITQGNKTMVVKEMLLPAVTEEIRLPFYERLAKIGELMKSINHPNICSTTDYFMERGCFYLVMDYIEGEHLDDLLRDQLIKKGKGFPEKQVIEWIIQACNALEYLHTFQPLSFYCGTLKSKELMYIKLEDRIVLIDYGTPQIMASLLPIYSKGFSAPEQYQGKITAQSDIYALGIILYHLLVGSVPDNTTNIPQLLQRYCPELQEETVAIIAKAVKEDPQERFSSVSEMKEELNIAYKKLSRVIATKTNWLMERGNPQRSGSYGKALNHPIKFRWSYETGKGAISSPAVAEGIVYVAAFDGYLFALEGNSGEIKWEYKLRGNLTSSPVVYEGALFIGSMDSHLYSLDLQSISLRWKLKTGGLITSSPAVIEDIVYVGSYDQHIYAIDCTNGNLLWKFNTTGTITSSPLVYQEFVYIGSLNNFVYALNKKDGSLVWEYQTGYSISSCAAGFEDQIYIASNDGVLYCFNAKSGTPLWKINTGAPITCNPVIFEELVYIGNHNGVLIAANAKSGELQWQIRISEPFANSSAISGNYLYFCGEKHNLYVFNILEKRLEYVVQIPYNFSYSPVVAEGFLFAGTQEGYVYAFK